MSALPALSPSPAVTRVVLADEPGFSRDAVGGLLAATSGVEVVGVVADPRSLRPALARLAPDVLVIDDRLLQHLDWLPADAGVHAIVIGIDDDPGYAARATRLGALTWLPKERADLLVDAVLEAVAKYGPAARPTSSSVPAVTAPAQAASA